MEKKGNFLAYLPLLIAFWNGTVYTMLTPLYDVNKTYEDNIARIVTIGQQCAKSDYEVGKKKEILGYSIGIPVGIAPCPLTATSQGIRLAAQLGYNVLTYKTIRSIESKPYSYPNIVFINNMSESLKNEDLYTRVIGSMVLDIKNQITIANSIGSPCEELLKSTEDIKRAREYLQEGQLLIVSVLGQELSSRTLTKDFAFLAQQAESAGAHIVEANLSCPNVKEKKLYLRPQCVADIVKAMVAEIKIPLIVKIGVFDSIESMKETVCAAAHAGARGIVGINAVPMQVYNATNAPYFGDSRSIAGISGSAIRQIALSFIKDLRKINEEEDLKLAIFATGGVTDPEDFDLFFDAGADVVLVATSAMFNPDLAKSYINQH